MAKARTAITTLYPISLQRVAEALAATASTIKAQELEGFKRARSVSSTLLDDIITILRVSCHDLRILAPVARPLVLFLSFRCAARPAAGQPLAYAHACSPHTATPSIHPIPPHTTTIIDTSICFSSQPTPFAHRIHRTSCLSIAFLPVILSLQSLSFLARFLCARIWLAAAFHACDSCLGTFRQRSSQGAYAHQSDDVIIHIVRPHSCVWNIKRTYYEYHLNARFHTPGLQAAFAFCSCYKFRIAIGSSRPADHRCICVQTRGTQLKMATSRPPRCRTCATCH